MTRIDCSSDFLHMNWANDAGVLMRCNTKKISNTHHLIHKHEYYFRSPSFFHVAQNSWFGAVVFESGKLEMQRSFL
jgi:hypothetical protein